MQQGCGRWGWSKTPRDFAPGRGVCGWFVSWFFSPALGGGGKASLVGSTSHLQIRGRVSPRRRQQHRDPGLRVGDPPPEPCPPQRCCAAAEPGWAPRAAVGVVHPQSWSTRVNPSGSVRHVSLGSLQEGRGSHVPTGAHSASPVLLAAAFPGPPWVLHRGPLSLPAQTPAESRGEPRAAPLAAGAWRTRIQRQIT